MTSVHARRSRLCGALLGLMLIISPVLADGTYTVKPGDTLSEIAQQFSVSTDAIISINHIGTPDNLAVGQELNLPAGAVIHKEEPLKASPKVAPVVAPKVAPKVAPVVAPKVAPIVAPVVAPKVAPIVAPKVAPITAPVVSAKAMAKATVKATAEPKPKARPMTRRELEEARARRIAAQQRTVPGDDIVQSARKYLGTRYSYGGLSSRGIDCSGLVVRAMAANSKQVPHSSVELFRMGKPVRFGELQPGDLVFFNTNGHGISHVGIWAGDNTFIHASCNKGVTVSSIKEKYYAKRLVGARRVR